MALVWLCASPFLPPHALQGGADGEAPPPRVTQSAWKRVGSPRIDFLYNTPVSMQGQVQVRDNPDQTRTLQLPYLQLLLPGDGRIVAPASPHGTWQTHAIRLCITK
jgi:hypothetical protein